MAVGPPAVFSAGYHVGSRWSGDIAVSQDGQLDVVHTGVGPQCGLTMEEGGDTFVTQATEGTARGEVFAVASTDLADRSSPSATVADPGSLVSKVAVSHFSLSPLEREPLGK
jgi:hypothetical protein